MHYLAKQTSFYGIKPTHAMKRFVHRQIEKWIMRKKSLLFLPNDCFYHASISKEANSTFTICRLQVQIGGCLWESQDSGRSIHDAVYHALQALRIQHRNDPPNTPHLIAAEGVA